MLDPVLLAQLQRLAAELDGELVHHPLDAEGRLRTPGAAVGVGPGLVGEDVGAREVVGRELVDAVEHERTQDRHARGDQAEVGAHVGQQLDLQAGDGAVLLGRQRQALDLVPAVVTGHDRLGARLGELDRLAQAAGHDECHQLLGGELQLAAEAAADVRGNHPDLGLGDAGHQRQEDPYEVRHLRRGPHGDLLASGVDHRGARLHEGGDQSLLTELSLNDDAVDAGSRDRLFYVTAGASGGRVEDPGCAVVGAEVGVREVGSVGDRGLHVEHRREHVVLDVNQVGCIARLADRPGHDDDDGLAGERDVVDRDRGVTGRLHVRRDRPRARQAALFGVQVGAGQDRHHIGGGLGRGRVDRGDPGMCVGAAHERQVQHAGQRDVVGPLGATGDQALVLFAQAGLAQLAGGGAVVDGGHATPAGVEALALAAACTDFTMFW